MGGWPTLAVLVVVVVLAVTTMAVAAVAAAAVAAAESVLLAGPEGVPVVVVLVMTYFGCGKSSIFSALALLLATIADALFRNPVVSTVTPLACVCSRRVS